MGDGSGDLQRVWHEYAGQMFNGVKILDVGAGYGRSKGRLSNSGTNTVVTQDINRALMTTVDLICDVRHIDFQEHKFDVITFFDVIEHVPDPSSFLAFTLSKATKGVVFSTPNFLLYPTPWHFTSEQLVRLVESTEGCDTAACRWFVRHRAGDLDSVSEVSRQIFLESADAYAFGVYLPRKVG